MCKEVWKTDNFYVKNYKDMTPDDINEGDLVVCNGLCTICGDGEVCIEHIMSLQCQDVLIQRQVIHDEENSYSTYEAYGITTYDSKLNRQYLKDLAKKYNYNLELSVLYAADKNYEIILDLRD